MITAACNRKPAARPPLPLVPPQEQRNVANVVKKFNLSQKFVDMSYGIFKQLDLDKNGAIDQK